MNRYPEPLTSWRSCFCLRNFTKRRGLKRPSAMTWFYIEWIARHEVGRSRIIADDRGHVDAQKIFDTRFIYNFSHRTEATHDTVVQQQRFVGEQRNQIDVVQNGDDRNSLLDAER